MPDVLIECKWKYSFSGNSLTAMAFCIRVGWRMRMHVGVNDAVRVSEPEDGVGKCSPYLSLHSRSGISAAKAANRPITPVERRCISG